MVRATQNKKQSKATGTQTTVLRRKTTKEIQHGVVSCLAKYIKEIVYPDFSELREEIGKHEFVSMRIDLGTNDPDTGDEFTLPSWTKVLFVLPNCAIVQEVCLTWTATRFKTHKIMYGEEWESKFHGWIDADHPRHQDCLDSWEEGMREYGADI
jgi:hypothetical protein